MAQEFILIRQQMIQVPNAGCYNLILEAIMRDFPYGIIFAFLLFGIIMLGIVHSNFVHIS